MIKINRNNDKLKTKLFATGSYASFNNFFDEKYFYSIYGAGKAKVADFDLDGDSDIALSVVSCAADFSIGALLQPEIKKTARKAKINVLKMLLFFLKTNMKRSFLHPLCLRIKL